VISFGTGTGYAFAQRTPGTRIFNVRFANLQITFGGSASGGIDLYDVSLARLDNVAIFGPGLGSGIGFRVASTVNGNALYNRFDHCRALSCNYGWSIEAQGSNDQHLSDCRTAACARGVSIVDSNHIVIESSCFESGTVGVRIEATTANVSDACTLAHNRFEGNTTNIVYGGTAANIRYPTRVANDHVTGTPSSGTPTNETNLDGAGVGLAITTQVQDTPFRLQRDTNGGSLLPCLFVLDAVTTVGTPTTVRAAAGRNAGRVFEGGTWNGSLFTATFHVTATGDLTAATITTPAITLTGNLTMHTPGQLLLMGDGTTAGNVTQVHRKADGNNLTTREYRLGTSTGIWAEQFNSGEDLNWLNSGSSSVGGWQFTGNYWRAFAGVRLVSNSGPLIVAGAGAPAAAHPDGSLYLRTDGTAGTTIYVRAAGAWSAIA
jgi:hypothetical protein